VFAANQEQAIAMVRPITALAAPGEKEDGFIAEMPSHNKS